MRPPSPLSLPARHAGAVLIVRVWPLPHLVRQAHLFRPCKFRKSAAPLQLLIPVSEVRLCRFASDHALAAVKVVDLRTRRRMFVRELEALPRLNHAGIVRYRGHVVDTNDFGFLVLDYVPYATLDAVLARHGALSEAHALAVFAQLADAMAHVHARGVAHRDLKTENILYDMATRRAVIVDFGLSKVHARGEYAREYVGTPSNMAPEVLAKCRYQPDKADSWALGIVLLEMLLGYHPYNDAEDEADLQRLHRDVWDFTLFSAPTAQLLHALLHVDYRQRCSAADAVSFVHALLAHDLATAGHDAERPGHAHTFAVSVKAS